MFNLKFLSNMFCKPVNQTEKPSDTQFAQQQHERYPLRNPDGDGVLFQNKKKILDSDPTIIGKCKVDGVKYWLRAEVKTNEHGEFLSLEFRKCQDKYQPKKYLTKKQ